MATRNAWLKNAHQKCMTDIHTKQWCKQMPAKHANPKIVTNMATGSPQPKKILFTSMPTKNCHKNGTSMAGRDT